MSATRVETDMSQFEAGLANEFCHLADAGASRCLCGAPVKPDSWCGAIGDVAPMTRCPGCGNLACPDCDAEARR